ncbi:tetratricopeptide (TPR) repeat protein [Deinobacterium chartae]|uniref:Tetratricopeptide (TPR) repeat protein n=1 Tax=Deinobacterium chartae TaxID=521158 RepID=A0A841HY69_9DEIO|nr:tetratricopeptide repeat protein [Deinobacterium chartae]MBB6097836.1 tetratricopeptide (TPR) repeat protein [Deinobacterium chartae]
MTLTFPRWLPLLLLPTLYFPVQHSLQDLRADPLEARAQAALETADFDGARQALRAAVQADPRDASLEVQLGRLARTAWIFLGDAGGKQEADAAFERAAQLSPHWTTPPYEHALMYAGSRQPEQALAYLDRALELDPNNAGFWLERGRILEALGRTADARAAYQRSQEIYPNPDAQAALNRLN